MMGDQKIVLIDGSKFAMNPNFTAILNSYFSQKPPALAIILSIRSYCPDISWNEVSVIAGGLIKVMEMSGHALAAAAIKNDLDAKIPDEPINIKSQLDDIMKKIQEEHDMK